jgi:asparagine synthase (glutamine-hydrolysing)
LLPARRHLVRAKALSPLAQALYFNFQAYLPGDLNVKMDRCSMAHGLETRSPFLDTEVLEYAAQLPDHLKLGGLDTKVILKEAFADLLPRAIQRRGKQGFGVPLDRWFRTELHEAVCGLLLASDARSRAYLRPEVVRGYWDAHVRGEGNYGLALWNLLTFEVWLRTLARGARASPAAEFVESGRGGSAR